MLVGCHSGLSEPGNLEQWIGIGQYGLCFLRASGHHKVSDTSQSTCGIEGAHVDGRRDFASDETATRRINTSCNPDGRARVASVPVRADRPLQYMEATTPTDPP